MGVGFVMRTASSYALNDDIVEHGFFLGVSSGFHMVTISSERGSVCNRTIADHGRVQVPLPCARDRKSVV